MNDKKKGIGLKFALQGLKYIFRHEKNFKIHLLMAFLAIGASIYFQITASEWIGVILVIGFVLGMEIVNTAIEQLLDHIHPSFHPTIKIVKDMLASAVLLSAITAVILGIIIFLPKVITLFHEFFDF